MMTDEQVEQLERAFYPDGTSRVDGEHASAHQKRQAEHLARMMEDDAEEAAAFDATDMRAMGEVLAVMADRAVAQEVDEADKGHAAEFRRAREDELARFLREYNAITSPRELASRIIIHVGELRREAWVCSSTEECEAILDQAMLLDCALDTPHFVSATQAERGMLRVAQARVDHLKLTIERHYGV